MTLGDNNLSSSAPCIWDCIKKVGISYATILDFILHAYQEFHSIVSSNLSLYPDSYLLVSGHSPKPLLFVV
jgi:hypothetical protein